MSIGFLFFLRDSLSFVIAVAIASSSRILFSNPFMQKLRPTINIYLVKPDPMHGWVLNASLLRLIQMMWIPGTPYLIIDNAAMGIYYFPMARIARIVVLGLPHHITQNELDAIRKHERTGRPLGGDNFLSLLQISSILLQIQQIENVQFCWSWFIFLW